MNRINIKLITVAFVMSGLLLASCSDVNPVSSETEGDLASDEVSGELIKSNMYDEVLAMEYYPSQGFHVLSVRNSGTGDIDTYYGDNKSWTKLNDNRDAGVAWGEFKAMSVGDNGDFVYAFLFNGSEVAVQSGREFSNKPFFDTGKFIIKDDNGNTYDEVLALEYYPSQGFHVLSVRNSGTGVVDTYYGDDKSWTKLNDNRDAGVASGEFKAMSVGDNGDFIYAFLHNGSEVAVQSGREFSSKPFFDKGKFVIKDGGGNTYDEVLALEYYPSEGFHVLSVRNSGTGVVDTYYGDDKSWTKLNDNRDAGVAWGTFKAMSVGENGDFVYAFLFKGDRVAVQSGREFYNKPYFDKGKFIIKK